MVKIFSFCANIQGVYKNHILRMLNGANMFVLNYINEADTKEMTKLVRTFFVKDK